MAINLGETTRIKSSWDIDGVSFDPVSVTLTVALPNVAPAFVTPIIRDSVGEYHYDLVATSIGSILCTWSVVDSFGNTFTLEEVVEVAAVPEMPRFMTSYELELCIGAALVDQLFDDNGDSKRDRPLVSQVLRRAEDYMMSALLGAWGDVNTLVKLAQADATLRMHVAWVACELASERRPALAASDGKGQFWAQLTRADAYFDSLYKAKAASVGEETVAVNANTGGRVNPPRQGNASRFTFAADRRNPGGRGGF
jgi:hypothetical protein